MQNDEALDLRFDAIRQILLVLLTFFKHKSFERTLQKFIDEHFLTLLGPHVNFNTVVVIFLQKRYFGLQINQLIFPTLFIQQIQPFSDETHVFVVHECEYLNDVPGL
jgi:hypothetical protein